MQPASVQGEAASARSHGAVTRANHTKSNTVVRRSLWVWFSTPVFVWFAFIFLPASDCEVRSV